MTTSPSTGGLLPNAMTQFLDGNGVPYAGGTVYFYIPGTSTPKNTWQDPALSILNPNPVLLDGDGRAIIWGLGSYRQVLYAANGDQIWDQLTAYGNFGTIILPTLNVWNTVSTGVYGAFTLVDNTSGGTAMFLADGFGGVTHSVYNGITGLGAQMSGTSFQVEITSGLIPRVLTFSCLVAGST